MRNIYQSSHSYRKATPKNIKPYRQTVFCQVDSGHEFTRKRLVEMESTLERKIADTTDDSSKVMRAWGVGMVCPGQKTWKDEVGQRLKCKLMFFLALTGVCKNVQWHWFVFTPKSIFERGWHGAVCMCVCVHAQSLFESFWGESIAENFYNQKHWIYDFKHVRNGFSCNAVHQVQCLGITIHAFPNCSSLGSFFLIIQNQQKHLQYIFTSTNR